MNKEDRQKVIQLEELDRSCRCCGHGREYICDRCDDLLQNGYAVFIEVEDDSTMDRKRLTGYALAVPAHRYWIPGSRNEAMEANCIYFIHQTELKKFLGNDYRHPKGGRLKPSKFLTTAPRPINGHPKNSTRSAAELCHY
jgi:hypothetical protein